MKKILLILLFGFMVMLTLHASKTQVSSANEINNGSWNPGDTIVMENGTWENQVISLRAFGTSEQPIVLIAETPGSVILNGTSRLALSGSYIVVEGLHFKDGNLSGFDVISFRTSSSNLANNCRVSNCAIENYNPLDNTVDSKWVSIYGEKNQVDRCSFENKNNSGTLLVVWLKSGITPEHIIKDNYFGYRNANKDSNGKELNGQEIIRIGDSNTSMQTAGVHVTGNFFEKCNGEIEIISNKSGGNYYSNNIFYECQGMLTLRHGNNCTVEGNYFFGNNISNTGGVRIIGEDHKVYNNYFENLRGTNYRSAVCIVRGKENSALNEYYQVKNALVMFNTMVNCSQSFSINYNSSSSLKMPPIGTTIAHNHVFNTSSKTNVKIEQVGIADMDVTWKNNLMNLGSYSNFLYASDEVITDVNAGMTLAGTTPNMFEPSGDTGLSGYTTSEYPEVTSDIRGRERGALKLPGASDVSGTVSRNIPQMSSVGASFLQLPTFTLPLINQDLIKVYSDKNQLITDVAVAGKLLVYDLNGICVLSTTVEAGVNRNTVQMEGVFIVAFTAKNGEVSVNKIAFQ